MKPFDLSTPLVSSKGQGPSLAFLEWLQSLQADLDALRAENEALTARVEALEAYHP